MKHFIKVVNNVGFTRDGIENCEEQVEFIPLTDLAKVYRYICDDGLYIIAYVFYDPDKDGKKRTFYEKLTPYLYIQKIQELEARLCPVSYRPGMIGAGREDE